MNFDPEGPEFEGYDSDAASDLEELEIALYSQIHHEQNTDLNDSLGLSRLFDVEEKRSSERNDDDSSNPCVLFDGKPSQRFMVGGSASLPLSGRGEDKGDEVGLVNVPVKKDKKKKKKKKKGEKIVKDDKPTDIESLFVPYVESEEEFIVIDSTDGEDDNIMLPNVHTNLVLNCEEIDMAVIHSKMSDKGWHIDDKDRYSSSSSKNRYYTAFNVRCHNCDEKGHLSKCCPHPKKLSTCSLCSEKGHTNRNCPGSLCFNCSQPGHASRDCQQRRRRRFDECHRCQMYGHMKFDCPDLWRQFHLTVHGPGYPPVRVPKVENKRVFCYNCASEGHYGHECDREMMDRFRNVQIPFIARYDTSKPHHGVKRTHDNYEEPSFGGSNKRQRIDDRGSYRNAPNYNSQEWTSEPNRKHYQGAKNPRLNTHAKAFLNTNVDTNFKKGKRKPKKKNEEDFPRGRSPNIELTKKGKTKKNKNKKKTKPQNHPDDSNWWEKKKGKGRCRKGNSQTGKPKTMKNKKADDVYGHRVSSHRWQ